MFDIVGCPQDGCDVPAESVPVSYSLNPAGQYTIHRRVMCALGHVTYTEEAAISGQETPPLAG